MGVDNGVLGVFDIMFLMGVVGMKLVKGFDSGGGGVVRVTTGLLSKIGDESSLFVSLELFSAIVGNFESTAMV